MSEDTDKGLYSINAERALLGSLMINNDFIDDVTGIITAECFYLQQHQVIYSTILYNVSKGYTADPYSVYSSAVVQYSNYKDIIDEEYIQNLKNDILSLNNNTITTYAKLISNCYVKRNLTTVSQNILSNLQNIESADEIINLAEHDIFAISHHINKIHTISNLETPLKSILDKIEQLKENKQLPGLSSGLSTLDYKLGGLMNSNLIILAGRPSMGKTALALSIAYNIAKKTHESNEGGVLVFSLEMSSEQLTARMLSMDSTVPSDKILKGSHVDENQATHYLDDEDISKIHTSILTLKDLPLYIDDRPLLTIDMIRSQCRRVERKHGLAAIFIDYIQLISTNNKRSNESRTTEISEISRGLKAIAREFNVPVIALSQLSRAVESRDNKMPILSDLRESGSIEQDADIVGFIFRESYYLERNRPMESDDNYEMNLEKWNTKLDTIKDNATVMVAKNRHGSVGIVDLHFDRHISKFYCKS